MDRNSIMESDMESPFENIERRSLMQTYDPSKLPTNGAQNRKASALEIYSAKHMEILENQMKIIDDQ